MANNNITLAKLTGLSEQDLAEVFAKNPRAYMAVKGAVAEKHLEKLLLEYQANGKIKCFTTASGDFDKDFYVILNDGKKISLECKNIQVLSTSNKTLVSQYINFLIDNSYLDESWLKGTINNLIKSGGILLEPDSKDSIDSLEDIFKLILSQKTKTTDKVYKSFPQDLRESGVPRYEFSSLLVKESDALVNDIDTFITQFDDHPLSIDFQRTRNSTDDDGDTKKQRFYCLDEIDVVGACLFSRTMKWQFVFGHSRHFAIHKKYEDRYANKLLIEPGKWSSDLISSLSIK